MLAPNIAPLDSPEQPTVLTEELEFYQSYQWCLNPHITVTDAISHLQEEFAKLPSAPREWQLKEGLANIFLLSCGLLTSLDEYLSGPTLPLVKRVAGARFSRTSNGLLRALTVPSWRRSRVERWRAQWLFNLTNLISFIISAGVHVECFLEAAKRLEAVLQMSLPASLHTRQLNIPSPFGHLDLTPDDVLGLGNEFLLRFPERGQPILLVGLRTSGSYFAPLLQAFLQMHGYRDVELLTIDPKDVARREWQVLERFASRGFWTLILDDPPASGQTVLAALDSITRAGFALSNVKILAPTHPARPDWFIGLPEAAVITLAPEHWHKRKLLLSRAVKLRLTEYFCNQGFTRVSIAASYSPEYLNPHLLRKPCDERLSRLKRVFKVCLETSSGEKHTRYILAKSVGWGWLGYRAFLMGLRLSGYVPPILGLRDGILYMEWLPHQTTDLTSERERLLSASALYTAARVRRLNLSGTKGGLNLNRYNNAHRLLAYALSRGYGRLIPERLMRSRLAALLGNRECPVPTVIDGNMHPGEWVIGPYGLIKTDYEHHGIGKNGPNVIDPAYDLADTLLNLDLSRKEEEELIRRYIAESGDNTVEHRLFLHKLIAGLWTINEVQMQLFNSPHGRQAQQYYHSRFMNAWNFLTVHTARHCGSLCNPGTGLMWKAPVVFLDIDGVLDRRIFGFPATTATGIKALSLLKAHGVCTALNTARSAGEVKEYCHAYALAGGVAEYGSYLWDAVQQREKVLISAEAARQLDKLRVYLRKIPGVFLDERHQYSIKAFSYRQKPPRRILSLLRSEHASSIGDGVLTPISSQIIHQALVDLHLNKLSFFHTSIDTTIIVKETNKGAGLTALRDWVLGREVETIAVGDGERDLAMFSVASRSFAPANIGCRRQAQLLGCQVAPYQYQRGLLYVVRNIIHPDDGHCEQCEGGKNNPLGEDDLFFSALQAADERWSWNLFRAIMHPAASFSFLIH
jgi:hydroxymethylpyrimidine pyrophosphatase-like HAD family hydrolase